MEATPPVEKSIKDTLSNLALGDVWVTPASRKWGIRKSAKRQEINICLRVHQGNAFVCLLPVGMPVCESKQKKKRKTPRKARRIPTTSHD